MLGGRDSDVSAEPGLNARAVLGDRVRASLQARTGRDYSELSDAEALDGIEYFLFPNFMPWAGFLTPFAYRFRPNGHDPDSCVMDIMKLEPTPEGEARPAPAPTRYLGPGEDWADVPEFGALGRVFNQDTARFERIQRGSAGVGAIRLSLSRYQESRIRHFHATLDEVPGEIQPPSNLEPVAVARVDEPILDSTIASILRDAAARAPDRIAVVAGTADPGLRRRRTYAQADAEAEAVARALAARCLPENESRCSRRAPRSHSC